MQPVKLLIISAANQVFIKPWAYGFVIIFMITNTKTGE